MPDKELYHKGVSEGERWPDGCLKGEVRWGVFYRDPGEEYKLQTQLGDDGIFDTYDEARAACWDEISSVVGKITLRFRFCAAAPKDDYA